MKSHCYCSVGDGKYAFMLQALVHSYQQVGMQEDFFAISDRQIHGAYTYLIPHYDKSNYFFKVLFLENLFMHLEYRYFVFLDADCYFVRPVKDILSLMHGDRLHVFLESDCNSELAKKGRNKWKAAPLEIFKEMMHRKGLDPEKLYTVNGGFFIIARKAIPEFCRLMRDFLKSNLEITWQSSDEPPLSYAMYKMVKDPEEHTLRTNPDVWASDWKGEFKGLPEDREWMFTDYLTYEQFPVNPAIVHVLVNKEPLIELGKKIMAEG